MATKPIIWSSRANEEFKDILEFFVRRNGNNKYALQLLEQTEEYLEVLAENEHLGRLTSNRKTRVLVMDVYLIFYETNKNSIHILSFWDNRQDLKKRIDNF